MENKQVNVNKSTGFCTLLTIAFIVLKLCGVITWSWIWVLSPLWIAFAIILVLAIIIVILKALTGQL